MVQEMWNAPPGFRPTKSAPPSPAKPLGISITRSESFHVRHKVPVGDSPYVRAKNVQLVEKDPERSIPLFWAAINAGDRVDSALKDMAIVMKQQNRAEEAIEAVKSLRIRCSDQAQESLDNILLDLYKRCGRLDDQVALLRHKLFLIQQGVAFNGKRTKTARSQGKKFQVSVEQEATRLLGNLGWALMQQNNYIEAEDAYRRALLIAPDSNKMCNLGICLMKQGRLSEAKQTLRLVKPAVINGPKGVDSHLKAYERAQQMLRDLESEMMNKGGDNRVEQKKLFEAFLGSSSIWQPLPCKEQAFPPKIIKPENSFADENMNSSNIMVQKSGKPIGQYGNSSLHCREETIQPRPTISKRVDGFADENFNSNTIADHKLPFGKYGNSLNGNAAPFFSSNFGADPTENYAHDTTLKRKGELKDPILGQENKVKRRSLSPDVADNKWADLLPDNKEFEDAIIAAVLGTSSEMEKVVSPGISVRKIDKRLKAFQDIPLCPSPRA